VVLRQRSLKGVSSFLVLDHPIKKPVKGLIWAVEWDPRLQHCL
jgi:hypothetical protein